ncbi:hypothetical protein DRN32_01880 [Thermococci archaeon]|nr:MAG: hypothetical protein DRN32_01880 [Thermococci archaeon]HDO75638.1 sugar transferase [Candidatus Poribacteria bacterium]HEX29243.1 sugar transferase [Candidatus Poribacteria bacterium]
MHYSEYCIRGAKYLISPTGDIRFYDDLRKVVKHHREFLRYVESMPRRELPLQYLILKRCIDLLGAIIGLLCCLLPFLVIIIAIKFDSAGSPFYRQARVGKNGKVFKIIKFRTMFKDAESKTGPIWAAQSDPRLTRVGKFLRRTKLDELPQLVNILLGQMSFVGPRPERPEFVFRFVEIMPAYDRRHEIKPGLTGLAQLRHGYDKSATSVYRKLRWDIKYMERIGLKMDIWLILKTISALVRGKV